MTAVATKNERLYALLVATDQSPARFAGKVGVDPKTVERWITTGRNPHPRIARRAANLLNVEDTYLWPTLYARRQATICPSDELIACYPGRSAVPGDLWGRLLNAATERIVLADPDSAVNPLDAARLRAVEATYQPLTDCHGVNVARYVGPLTNTVIRIDDDVLVRAPIDGCPVALAPILHLRYLPAGSLARLYLTSLDCVWDTCLPIHHATGPNLRVAS